MGVVLEIAVLRVLADIEPIVRDADVEAANRIGKCQVELLRVGWVGNAVTALG